MQGRGTECKNNRSHVVPEKKREKKVLEPDLLLRFFLVHYHLNNVAVYKGAR